ncbi:MAG: biopolymer transporter ExbD [Candidatus Manganitrophaceae bacterium]
MGGTLFKKKKKEKIEAALLPFKLGYISLMITLVPFLLTIAVFSRLAIVDLHLPKLDDRSGGGVSLHKTESPAATSSFHLTVAIEEEGTTVADGRKRISFIKHREGKPDAEALSALMQQLKQAHPDAREVVLLSRPKTRYDDLIAVMDACRTVRMVAGGISRSESLFPDVSLGEIS